MDFFTWEWSSIFQIVEKADVFLRCPCHSLLVLVGCLKRACTFWPYVHFVNLTAWFRLGLIVFSATVSPVLKASFCAFNLACPDRPGCLICLCGDISDHTNILQAFECTQTETQRTTGCLQLIKTCPNPGGQILTCFTIGFFSWSAKACMQELPLQRDCYEWRKRGIWYLWQNCDTMN